MELQDATVEGTGQPSTWARVRANAFGPSSEEPYRRRVSDWIRVVVGAGLLVPFMLHHGDVDQPERDLANAVHSLPDALASPVRLLYGLGALWAVALVVAAIVTRRRRLVRDLIVGVAATWAISRVMAAIVGEAVFTHSFDVFIQVQPTATVFPALRVALLVAVISVASPFLTRPVRRIGHTLVVLMLFGALYIGATANEVLAGLVLGWAVAAGVHLVWGSPGGRPTSAQVRAALAELGVSVHDVSLAPEQPRNATRMIAYDDRGPLRARVLGRDEADAQFLAKFWRWLLYREGGPAVHFTRLEDVQSEAYSLLLAERAGVHVAEVVVGGVAGPGTALLLTRRPDGAVTLADVEPELITDDVLADLWTQVRRLHDAHVAHGRLNTHHVMIGSKGVALVDFERSSGSGTTSVRRAGDVAELLASTAAIVGKERATRAALAGVGATEVTAALPVLQPAALSHEFRQSRGRRELAGQLDDLRADVALQLGTTTPPLHDLYRVKPANVLMAVGTLIGLAALFSQVGSPEQLWDTMSSADATWVVVALAGVLLSNFACAIALMGTVPINLPLMRTTELQVSMSFANLAVPAVGGSASQVRFLQKQGMDLAGAVASGGLLATVANVVAQLGLLVVALQLRPPGYNGGSDINMSTLVQFALIAILVVGVVGGVAAGIPRLRRAIVTPARSALSTLWAVLRSPRQVFLMIAGNVVNALIAAGVYAACLAAVGGTVNYWTLLSLNIVIGTIASLIPIPGGGTAVSSVGMSGALAAAGVNIEVAVAAALINQVVVNFIPAIPGWFATRDLLHADYL